VGDCALGYYGFDPTSGYGAATNVSKYAVILLSAGGIPKSLVSRLGVRVIQLEGASRFTGLLSILSQGMGTAASGENWLRIAGKAASRIAVPVFIASVAIDATAIGTCTLLDQ
jgi:hypothetical protein